MDTLIAAQALRMGATVVTRNVREFGRVWGRRVAESVFAQLSIGRPTVFKLMAWVDGRGLGAIGFAPPLDIPGQSTDPSGKIPASALEREARAVVEGDVKISKWWTLQDSNL